MKRVWFAVMAAVVAMGVAAIGAELDPVSKDYDLARTDNPAAFTGVYFDGTTLTISGTVYSDAVSSNVQDLADITMELRVGNVNSNVVYVPTSTNEAGGHYTVDITIPSSTNITGTALLQWKFTDTNGVVVIYPRPSITRQTPLE